MFNGFINKNWPELDRYESAEEAEAAYVAAKKRATSGARQFMLLMSVMIVVAASLGGMTGYLLRGTKWSGSNWVGLVRNMIMVAVTALLYHRLVRSAITKAIREDLNLANYPTCMKCGYDLRGLQIQADHKTIRCPECGSSALAATSDSTPSLRAQNRQT